MRGEEDSAAVEDRKRVVAANGLAPQGAEESYILQGRAGNEEYGDEAEGSIVIGRPKRRQQSDLRIGVLAGVLFAGFFSVVLSALLMRPPRLQLWESWAGVIPHEEPWNLPSLEEQEGRTPAYLHYGRKQISDVVQGRKESSFARPGSLGQDVLRTLGERVSGRKGSSLVGAIVNLKQMQKLGSEEVDAEPHAFRVLNYISEGSGSVVLEVLELETQKTYAMQLQTVPREANGRHISRHLAESMHQQYTRRSTTAMLEALGRTPLDEAAEQRGLALIESVASIDGLPPVVQCSSVYAISEVYLMERFYGTLDEVFGGEYDLPTSSKVYAARRLLTEVLLLQSAGVSHNNLKPENIYIRGDGSLFIGNFDTATRIGEVVDRGVVSRFAEKELLLATTKAAPGAERPVAHAKSDMWSLGLCLYKIFTGGNLPYQLDEIFPTHVVFGMLEQQGVRSNTLIEPLVKAGVSHRWLHLILELLEPNRSQRIDAQGIMVHYADLLD
ncbi:hypothetical protein, conserved [Eimeria praecox]|uniref:Protein kinase domain-containing protein n=1 Tax=Eimeria praecox TaxID=51316 RepID=U6GJA5_9EIME|nr:hypothetical protein, conserved [Eimeria praecox]